MTTAKVAVLGATGAVGQTFVRLLAGHPWFRLAEVVASERRAGEPYGEAVDWTGDAPIPAEAGGLPLRTSDDDLDADVCFSALPAGTAAPVERALAARGYAVFTNARDLRMAPDVPLMIPEVNPDHLALIEAQPRTNRGLVVANGNCTAILLALALKPLADRFGLEACHLVSMQALSGAGYPGVPSLAITDNVIPYIADEEGKVESEVPKMLGRLGAGGVVPARLAVSATCTRVPVLDGHTLAVSVGLRERPPPAAIKDAWREFVAEPQRLRLPSAPARPLVYRDEPDRPQPRRDRDAGGGMSVSVGRLRLDPILGWKFLVAGSNTVRGAAGASLLNAELAVAKGFL